MRHSAGTGGPCGEWEPSCHSAVWGEGSHKDITVIQNHRAAVNADAAADSQTAPGPAQPHSEPPVIISNDLARPWLMLSSNA